MWQYLDPLRRTFATELVELVAARTSMQESSEANNNSRNDRRLDIRII